MGHIKLKRKFTMVAVTYCVISAVTAGTIFSNVVNIRDIYKIHSKNNSFVKELGTRREEIKSKLILNESGEINDVETMNLSMDIGHLKEDKQIQTHIKEIYDIENKILKIHNEKKVLENDFEIEYKNEKRLRHILQETTYENNDYNQIKLIGIVMYTSKESIFQYRDEEHFSKWQDACEEFVDSSSGSLKGYAVEYWDTSKIIGNTTLNIKAKENEISKLFSEYQNSLWSLDEDLSNFTSNQNMDFETETRSIIERTMLTLFLFLLISIAIGIYFNRKVIKPLLILTNTSNNFSHLNFNQNIDIASNDELGDLATSFNRMISIISGLYNDMDKKVVRRTKEIESLKNEFEKLATIDELTQIYNRRKINSVILGEFERVRRYGGDMSVMMVDIDKFKHVNDEYGHAVGDETLKQVANIIKSNIRSIDSVGRWGGEEFIIFCPNTEIREGILLAERIRVMVEEHEFDSVGRCTISLGVSNYKPDDENIDSIISRSDKAMYEAKAEGRNQVKTN